MCNFVSSNTLQHDPMFHGRRYELPGLLALWLLPVVMKDSPQPHCPFELGLINMNSVLLNKQRFRNKYILASRISSPFFFGKARTNYWLKKVVTLTWKERTKREKKNALLPWIIHKIHFSSNNMHKSLWINQYHDTLVLDHLIKFTLLICRQKILKV